MPRFLLGMVTGSALTLVVFGGGAAAAWYLSSAPPEAPAVAMASVAPAKVSAAAPPAVTAPGPTVAAALALADDKPADTAEPELINRKVKVISVGPDGIPLPEASSAPPP